MPQDPKNTFPEEVRDEYVAVPAVDIGATHLRIDLILRSIKTGLIYHDLAKATVWDLKVPVDEVKKLEEGPVGVLVRFIARSIEKKGIPDAKKRGFTVIKHVGVGSLGGYYPDGSMYPGTCPKRKEFEGISFASELEKAFGPGWKVHINNDGMVQALLTAEALLDSEKKKEIPRSALDKGKIMVIVPGTSIGGGGVIIEEDGVNVRPMPGPHQIWDIVLRSIKEGEEFLLMTEDDDSEPLKKVREGGAFLSLDIGGTNIDEKARMLGYSSGRQMGEALLDADNDDIVKIYKEIATDLAIVIKKMYAGEGEKAVVSGPDEVKEFWESTKGAEIFILGGWLIGNKRIKEIVFKTVKESLKAEGLDDLVLVAQDEIGQLANVVSKTGVLGAALLVPEEVLENVWKETSRRGFFLERIVPRIRNILKRDNDVDGAADSIGDLFFSLAKDPSLGPEYIPEIYSLTQENLENSELKFLSRVTFKIFTGLKVAEYAEKYSPEHICPDVLPEKDSRVFTLTPNPAIDLSIDCAMCFLGEEGDCERAFKIDPGGKGINISIGLHKWGVKTIPMGFVGGPTGNIMVGLMNSIGISTCYLTEIKDDTRINPSVHAARRHQVHLENPGPSISTGEQADLEEKLMGMLRPGDHLLMSGRLPRGIGEDYYREWIKRAKELGVKTCIDTRNVKVLENAIKAGPDFLGVNIKEFANCLGLEVEELKSSEKRIVEYSKSLLEKGIEKVVISMGSGGMVMTSKEGAWRSYPPEVCKVSSVGAGDTIKMAFVYADRNGMSDMDALRLATAASAVSVTKAGTELAELDESLDKMQDVVIKEVTVK